MAFSAVSIATNLPCTNHLSQGASYEHPHRFELVDSFRARLSLSDSTFLILVFDAAQERAHDAGYDLQPRPQAPPPLWFVVSDSHYRSTLDAVYLNLVPWSEFPIVPPYPHYPHLARCHETSLPGENKVGYTCSPWTSGLGGLVMFMCVIFPAGQNATREVVERKPRGSRQDEYV